MENDRVSIPGARLLPPNDNPGKHNHRDVAALQELRTRIDNEWQAAIAAAEKLSGDRAHHRRS